MKIDKNNLKKMEKYLPGQKILIVWNANATSMAVVVEDCGHKFKAGKVKFDYVRAKRYYKKTDKWTKVVRIPRDSIFGLIEGTK